MLSPKTSSLNLVYEGSVKRVWQPENPEQCLWFEFTDDYSVFDWGKMPDQIKNKGKALIAMGAYLFDLLNQSETWQNLFKNNVQGNINKSWLANLAKTTVAKQLQINGLPNHFQKTVTTNQNISLEQIAGSSDTVYLEVLKAKVNHPKPIQVFQQNLFHYPSLNPNDHKRLIPLEVVFRFGMPEGSSLKERLEKDPNYHKQLGLEYSPKENEWFEQPVIEFYTKLEPKDRLLSLQEAILISQLTPEQFQELIDLTFCTALCLNNIFSKVNIELWDGKFEFILYDGKIMLADSIGPDELRLIYKGSHLSKEIIRKFYRGTKWFKVMKQAQQIALQESKNDWKDICVNRLKESPEHLSHNFKETIDCLYGSLTNHLTGKQLFADQPTIDQLVQRLEAALK